MIKNYWYTHRVIIFNMISAALTAILPMTLYNKGHWDWKAIVVAATIAITGIYGNQKQGKSWTMGGAGFSGLITLVTGTEHELDYPHMLLYMAIAIFGVGIPPTKDSALGKTPIMQAADEQAKQIKEQAKIDDQVSKKI